MPNEHSHPNKCTRFESKSSHYTQSSCCNCRTGIAKYASTNDCTARCLLYVSQENGAWKAVGIGEGSLVASQIDVFSTSTDEDGSSQVIIDVPHMKQRYLMEDNDSFKPLFRSQNYNMKMKGISLKELMIVNNNQAIEANNVDHK